MSEPKCGLLGNVWLDNTTSEDVIYTPDTSNKKAVGTVAIHINGSEEYFYAGTWSSDSTYNVDAIVKFDGVMFRCVQKHSDKLPTDGDSANYWKTYRPQLINVVVKNKNYSADFNYNKSNASQFMIVFKSVINPWDGPIMIPGIVVSPQNSLIGFRGYDESNLESVVIGFNGIEEYL